jgi:hypothetical protein
VGTMGRLSEEEQRAVRESGEGEGGSAGVTEAPSGRWAPLDSTYSEFLAQVSS